MRSPLRQHSPASPAWQRLVLVTVLWLLLGLLAAVAASGQVEPRRAEALASKAVREPSLHIPLKLEREADLAPAERPAISVRLAALEPAATAAHLDRRSGRWATVVTSVPLVPGSGVGNDRRMIPAAGS